MNSTDQRRPVSIPHLIFGLVFTGVNLLWAIGEGTHTAIPKTAIAIPAILIGAGIVGLAASLTNQRRARARLHTDVLTDQAPADAAATDVVPTQEQDLS